jgi:hypothetical protein
MGVDDSGGVARSAHCTYETDQLILAFEKRALSRAYK